MKMHAEQTAEHPQPHARSAKESNDDGGLAVLVIVLFIVGIYALKLKIQSELGIGWSKDVSSGTRIYQGPEGEVRTASLLWTVFRWLLALAALFGAVQWLGLRLAP
ncbi:MAG: hypothetical protein U1E62_20140 [Alsobacter sp.]